MPTPNFPAHLNFRQRTDTMWVGFDPETGWSLYAHQDPIDWRVCRVYGVVLDSEGQATEMPYMGFGESIEQALASLDENAAEDFSAGGHFPDGELQDFPPEECTEAFCICGHCPDFVFHDLPL